MINQLCEFFISPGLLLGACKLPLSGLILTLGLAAHASSLATVVPQQQHGNGAKDSSTVLISQTLSSNTSIRDGTYLYGQSSQPNQIGKEYIVFKARQSTVVGALYLPQSEYSCFYGQVDSEQMNLTVVNPYNQTAALSHTIARQKLSTIATTGDNFNLENTSSSLTYPYALRLEGYQKLDEFSDNDLHILNTCLKEYQEKIYN
ncbi:MAG: hypothetical protein F6K36_00580 [Symploca sp. SIO3C6]|nr:hypothetical protein [Symploca sp. SIO3C6]